MIRSLTPAALARYTCAQLNTFFPDEHPIEVATIDHLLERVLSRLERCFHGLNNRYFHQGNEACFDHLHSEQYAMYLYVLGHEAWKIKPTVNRGLASKCYLLNKALHAVEVYYELSLPTVFWLAHSIGTVLGRAVYGNGFAVMQGCTVGNKGGSYPTFGERIVLCAGSSVIGNCKIGNDVCIGAGAQLIDIEVPDGSTVVGRGSDLRVLPKTSPILRQVFHPSLFT